MIRVESCGLCDNLKYDCDEPDYSLPTCQKLGDVVNLDIIHPDCPLEDVKDVAVELGKETQP
jgi:hypothetical protein